MINVNFKKNLLIFLILIVVSGFLSIIFMSFPDYDFYSYQYYNAWAFLNNRIGIDIMPAGFRTYFNPYLDLIHYFMVSKFNNHIIIYTLIMSIDNAVALFLGYKITDYIFVKNIKNRKTLIVLSLAYIILMPILIHLFDSIRNDIIIADFELLAFYILLKNIFVKPFSKKNFVNIAIAGSLMGIAMTLKLTAFVYCLTFTLCLICLYKKMDKPIKTIFIFGMSIVLTFLITDGYWLYKLYSYFHNPVFPHFNNIFHSPYANNVDTWSSDYAHIRANTWWRFIFYPFLWSKNFCYGYDNLSFDIRYAVNIILVFLIPLLIRYKKNINISGLNLNYTYFLLLFCLFSFYINTFLFGNYRYIAATSVLFGLVLLIALLVILPKQAKRNLVLIFMIIMCFISYITQKSNHDIRRVENGDKIIYKQNFKFEDNSYILLASEVVGYITDNNPKATYMGFVYPEPIYTELKTRIKYGFLGLFFDAVYYKSSYMENKLKEIFSSDNKVYLVIDYFLYRRLQKIILKTMKYYSNDNIENIHCTNINKIPSKTTIILVCTVKRKGSK